MYYWFLILLLFVVIGVLIVHRARLAGTGYVPPSQFVQQRRQANEANNSSRDIQFAFRAVSIECGDNPCAAAVRLEGRRGLHNQIPRVPLSNCDREVCNCRYKQHGDRREQDERRNAYSTLSGQLPDGVVERRATNDRRRSAIERDLEEFRIKYK